MSNATVAVAAKVSKDDIPFNPKVHYKKKVSDWVIDVIIWLLLALVVIAVLYPLWFVIISSFSSPNAVASGAVTFLPKDITLAGYEAVFKNDQIWNGYLNTIIYTVLGTIVNLVETGEMSLDDPIILTSYPDNEALAAELIQIPAVRGITKARALAPFVLDGSGSPLETTMCLLEFLPAELGGEGWEIPDLNRVVPLTERGRTVLEGDHLVADQLWADRNCLLEINGQEYHEGREAFARTSARRAALEAMGYVVREITYDQAADLDKLDTILTSWAEALSLRHQPRARAFVQRRAQLHAALFSIPGIHGNPAIRRPGW